METVELSFEGAYDEPTQRVLIHNPGVMPFALYTQIQRLGLIGDRKQTMTGKLRGTRKALTDLIHSYGLNFSIVAHS